jgi:hypothetical protein
MNPILPTTTAPWTSTSTITVTGAEKALRELEGILETMDMGKKAVPPDPPKILRAGTRLNKPTLAKLTPTQAMDKVKAKLLKDLFEQLVASNVIKITSTVNPTTGTTTFVAEVEVSKPA